MLTLEKLLEMDEQQLFEHIAEHLLTQGKPALRVLEENSQCCYRTEDGLKCAVGAIIPDELYREDMEGLTIIGLTNSLIRDRFERENRRFTPFFKYIEKHLDMLDKLQVIHDGHFGYCIKDGELESAPKNKLPWGNNGQIFDKKLLIEQFKVIAQGLELDSGFLKKYEEVEKSS